MNPALTRPTPGLSGALAAGVVVFASLPASAQLRTFEVRMANGSIINVTVDVPPSLPASQVPLPGQLIQEITSQAPPTPSVPSVPSPPSGGGSSGSTTQSTPSNTNTTSGGGSTSHSHSQSNSGTPSSHKGHKQQHSGSKQHAS